MHNPQAFPSPTISRAGVVEEATGALDGKIVSSEPTGRLIGLSAFLCVVKKHWEVFALYHDFLHLHDGQELFLRDGCESGRLTRFLSLVENAGHERRLRSALLRSPRTLVHVVQGPHEKTAGRQRTIYPLHLSEVHLPAYDATRAQASGPSTLMP